MFLTFTLIPLDPPVIDVAGIVNRYETQISQANSATGTLSFVRGGAAGTNRFFLEKPGKVAVISSNQKDICDGTKRLIIRPDEKTYETRPVALYGMPYQIGFEPFFSSLTSPSGNRMAFDSGRLATDATSVVVRRRTTQGSDVMEVNLDRTTGLPVGWTWLHNGQVTTARILDLVLDGPIPAGMFTPDLTGYRETPTPEAQALLPVGSIGPDLPLVGSNGRPTTLSQFAAKQAKTILVFVNPADPTSVAHLRMAADFGRVNRVTVLPITPSNDTQSNQALFRSLGLRGAYAQGSAGSLAVEKYHAHVLPTAYVVDRTGVIRGCWVGFDREQAQAAIAAK